MKSQNAQIAKLLQRVAFMYGVENAILVKKQGNIVGNAQNNRFGMYVTFEKRCVIAIQRHTLLDVKRSVFKNPVWTRKKISLNSVQRISYYEIICYIILIL